jgi:hypothetical protein
MLVYNALHTLHIASPSNYICEGVESKGDPVISYDLWRLFFQTSGDHFVVYMNNAWIDQFLGYLTMFWLNRMV